MTVIFSILGRVVGSTVMKSIGTAALLGFGWVFGQRAASKIVDRMESQTKERGKENRKS